MFKRHDCGRFGSPLYFRNIVLPQLAVAASATVDVVVASAEFLFG